MESAISYCRGSEHFKRSKKSIIIISKLDKTLNTIIDQFAGDRNINGTLFARREKTRRKDFQTLKLLEKTRKLREEEQKNC